MIQFGFSLIFSLLVLFVSWTGGIAPAAAQVTTQTSFNAPTVGIVMGKSLFSFSGKRPTNLGVKDGKLAACPSSPNCVNSQAADSDAEHKIAPLSYTSSPAEAMATLKSVIQSMERTEIITEENNYLYAEFTSALMGYVDDVEFFLDDATGTIQVRSASRLGQSDLGVNRKRIEAIRAKFAELQSNG